VSKPHPLAAADVPPRPLTTIYPAPFIARVAGRRKQALGDAFGLTKYGVNRTTLPPGAASALRHWHTQQDEFIYILSGRPTLVTSDGETQLEPGMCMGFKAGEPDGHQLVNKTAAEVVYLEVGDRARGDTVTYPDDDLRAVYGDDGKWRVLHKDGTPWA
jgi:uncharacterized cupin superfamily protein